MKLKKRDIILVVSIIGIVILMIVLNKNGVLDKNFKKNNEIIEVSTEEYLKNERNINYDDMENAIDNNGQKVNNSSNIKKEHYVLDNDNKEIKKLVISGMKLYSSLEQDLAVVEYNLTNNTDEVVDYEIVLRFYTKEGKRMGESYPYDVKELKPGESVKVSFNSAEDFINAYDYKISIL